MRRRSKNADICGIFCDGFGHRVAYLFFKMHLHVGIVAQKRLDVGRQELRDGRHAGTNPHQATHAARVALHLHRDLIEFVQRTPRQRHKRNACRSRLHALVGANQKRGAQSRFDFAEALADRRSGDMFTVGRRRNGALFNHADEQLERGGVKPQHGSYSSYGGLIECSFEPRFPRWQHHEWLLFPPAPARHNNDCLHQSSIQGVCK